MSRVPGRRAVRLFSLVPGLLLAGCLGGGGDDGVVVVRSAARAVTRDSAVLSGRARCEHAPTCWAHYRYRVAGSPRWLRVPATGGHRLTEEQGDAVVPRERVTGLLPATRYQYETCTGGGASERCRPPDGRFAQTGSFTTRLRYPPPALHRPETINLDGRPSYCEDGSATGADGSLDNDRDYVIRLPSTPLPCPLDVRGGHDVVIRGGEISIPAQDDTPRNPELHRGIYLSNQTGTVHVEGVRVGGEELSAPIVLNENLGATVQLQHIRADRIFTDYPDWRPLHADCIQTWAGPNVLRVDGYTCTTDYFGLQLSPSQYGDNANTWPDEMEFRHMNFRPWRADDRTRLMFWRTRLASRRAWWPISFDDVWTQPGYEGRGNNARLTCYSARFKASIPQNHGVWQELSHDQNCSLWPRFSFGQPPDGDFVKRRDVGLGYRSPGY
jgi:hypothetical protein